MSSILRKKTINLLIGQSEPNPYQAVRLKSPIKPMEAPIWLAYAAALLVTMAIMLLSNHLHRCSRLNLPPGPKRWPIIGNINLIGPLPHRSLQDLAKTYGPIMMLRLGSVPVLVGSSVEMARAFLKTHDEAFAGRPVTSAGKYTSYNYSDISWTQYGPYWRQMRKLCMVELFSAKKLEEYETLRSNELYAFLKGIYEASEQPILLKDHLSRFSLNLISRMVLGKSYLVKEDKYSIISPEEFKSMIDELPFFFGVFGIGDWIPCLKILDVVQGNLERMKAMAKKLDTFLELALNERVATRQNVERVCSPVSMADVLLDLIDDPNLEVRLEKKHVKAVIQDLIVGGTDSPAVIVEWAMSELLRKPDIISKAQAEIDCVVGKERWVQENDIQNLPYIQAIAKETMRLHPVLPMPRMSREDVKINGYNIPKGSLVMLNTFAIQRDPNVYQRSEEFYPERFFTKNIDVKGQDFELLPFGSGRRMCPGYVLGLKFIETSLANLLHGFTWQLPINMKCDLDMDETPGLSNPKKDPLEACPKPRLPQHLYYI